MKCDIPKKLIHTGSLIYRVRELGVGGGATAVTRGIGEAVLPRLGGSRRWWKARRSSWGWRFVGSLSNGVDD